MKLSNKLAYIIIGFVLAIAGTVYAAVSVPNATQKGDLPTGLTTGNYKLLHPGSDGLVLTSSSTSANGLAWQTASSTGGTGITSLNGLVGASQTFATGTMTGLNLIITSTGSTHTFSPSLQSGYVIPLQSTLDTFSTYAYGSSTYSSLTYASSSYATLWNLKAGTNVTISTSSGVTINGSSDSYIRGLFSNTAPITYNSGTGAIGCTTASSGVAGCLSNTAFDTFNNKQPAGTYLTASSTLTAGGVATFSPNVTFATGTDTNLLLSIVCATATCTYTPIWTGTLAAGRLNSNVVQAFTNDTNVTATISAQNATIAWSGVLAPARGGTGTSTVPTVQGQLLAADSSGSKYAPTNLLTTATLSVVTTTPQQISFNVLKVPNAVTFNNGGAGASSGQTFDGSTAATISYNTIGAQATLVSGTNIKTINSSSLLGSGDLVVTGSPCTATGYSVQYNNAGSLGCLTKLLTDGTLVGYNATSSTVSFNIQGTSGSTNDIFNVASSTGTSILKVSSLGVMTLAGPQTVTGTSTLATTTISGINVVGRFDKSFQIASTTLDTTNLQFSNATTTWNLWNPSYPVTLKKLYCKTDTGTLLLNFGGNLLTCTSGGASSTPSTNYAIEADVNASLGTAASTPNRVRVTASFQAQ